MNPHGAAPALALVPAALLALAVSLAGCVQAAPAAGESRPAAHPSKEVSMSDDTPLNIAGDRNAPPRVPAVVRDGVRYEQNLGAREAEFGQVGGVLSARNAASGALLWSIKVYDNRRQPGLEGDVQDVFFRSMAFDAKGRLVIENETGRRFAVDVATRSVEELR